jgi:hypothetical protein
MKILKFSEFLNEQSVYNTGVPLYRGTSFEPERTIKRNKLIPELKDLLTQVMNGSLSEITLVAEIPTQGKNAPQYLKDIYAKMGYNPNRDTEDEYDEENDTYLGNRDRNADDPSTNIFVDSEFLVKDIDETRNVIIAIPYSLKRKNVLVELTPEMVDEAFIK